MHELQYEMKAQFQPRRHTVSSAGSHQGEGLRQELCGSSKLGPVDWHTLWTQQLHQSLYTEYGLLSVTHHFTLNKLISSVTSCVCLKDCTIEDCFLCITSLTVKQLWFSDTLQVVELTLKQPFTGFDFELTGLHLHF